MQLLAPNVGWVLNSDGLYWTNDNGDHWARITPSMSHSMEGISDVFFLNSTTGWALLSTPEGPSGEPLFELASTFDAGATWTISQVLMPGLNPASTPLAPGGTLYFLDSSHGWLNLPVTSSANFRLALLLATQDGRHTWARLSLSRGGSLRFVTPNDGWLAGGPGGQYLYVTRDGGRSWNEVSLKAPPETGPAVYPLYDVPVFSDPKRGFLLVTYTAPEDSPSALALFSTEDGGRTWSPIRVVGGIASIGDVPLPSAVVGSAWVTARARNSTLTLTTTPLGTKGAAASETMSTVIQNLSAPVSELSFISADNGWVRAGALLATSDGGVTWNDITPNRARTSGLPSQSGKPKARKAVLP